MTTTKNTPNTPTRAEAISVLIEATKRATRAAHLAAIAEDDRAVYEQLYQIMLLVASMKRIVESEVQQ